MRRRRLRTPVIGRLTLAWSAFAALVGIAFMSAGGPQSSIRFALNTSSVDKLSPPPERLVQPARVSETALAQVQTDDATGNAVAAPVLARINRSGAPAQVAKNSGLIRSQAASPRVINIPTEFSSETSTSNHSFSGATYSEHEQNEDGSYDAVDILLEPAAEDIVITVDGAPAMAPGERLADKPRKARRPIIPIASIDVALSRNNEFGFAPAISKDGRRPSDHYAFAFAEQKKGAKVALIVGGLGLNNALTERAIDELPPEVTLAFAPYAKNLEKWSAKARAAGHEILLELPMEQGPNSAAVLGPAGLLTDRTPAENIQRLEWLLSRFGGYFGVTNYLGAKFTGETTAISPILARLRKSGLVFIDDTGGVKRFGDPAALGVTEVDRLIAARSDDAASDLNALERIAGRDGYSLGKAYLSPETFDAIAEWSLTVEERDFRLAPASAIFKLDGKGA